MKLWQHGEYGRLCWSEKCPGDQYREIPTTYEDEVGELSDDEYCHWFENSKIIDGVRMGYKI